MDAGGFWPRWSLPMRKVINVFICLTQIGSNAVYALFIAQNLQPIFEHYGGDFFKNLNYRVYIAMVLPFMLAMCSIRNLRSDIMIATCQIGYSDSVGKPKSKVSLYAIVTLCYDFEQSC